MAGTGGAGGENGPAAFGKGKNIVPGQLPGLILFARGPGGQTTAAGSGGKVKAITGDTGQATGGPGNGWLQVAGQATGKVGKSFARFFFLEVLPFRQLRYRGFEKTEFQAQAGTGRQGANTPQADPGPNKFCQQTGVGQHLADNRLLQGMGAVKLRKPCPGPGNQGGNGQVPGTCLLAGAAEQALGKDILKMTGGLSCKRQGEQMHLAAGGQGFPWIDPIYRTDHGAGAAFGTAKMCRTINHWAC